jgi:hypothetical protein
MIFRPPLYGKEANSSDEKHFLRWPNKDSYVGFNVRQVLVAALFTPINMPFSIYSYNMAVWYVVK